MNLFRNPRKRSIVMIGVTVLGIGLGLMTAASLIGREARLVDVLTIFFAAFGSGASLVDALLQWRRARHE